MLVINKYFLQDTGIDDALNKRYLQNIIFSIFADPENPTENFEMYIFSFSYSKNKVVMGFGSNCPDYMDSTSESSNYQGKF